MNRRVFYHRQSWHSHLRRPAVSLLCLAFGVAGVLFGLIAMSRPTSGPRCKEFEVRTVSVSFAASGIGGIADDRSSGGTTKRRKVMGFVGIQTGFGSFGRRRSLRKTWMPSDHEGLQRLEEATGLVFRFVIGKTSDSRKMSDLRKEVEEYDDFMLLDIEEQYSNLPHKTLAFFKSAYGLYDADFYVKADDDIYLRPDRLSVLLAKERPHTLTCLGCMKKRQVFTDPKLKWYEPLSHLLGSEYFLHAYGPIYALSAEVVTSLVALRNDSFRMFSNEDVTIGAWMLAMNVNHENNMALCETSCSPSSIAVWDLPKCSVPSDMMLLASCMGEVIQGLQEVLSLLGKYCFGEACFKNKSAMLLKWYGALQTGRAATKPSSDGGLFGNSNQSLIHDIVT